MTIESDLTDFTMPYGYGRQQPFILPRLINLNLPMSNPLKVMKPESPAPRMETQQNPTQADSPIHTEIFGNSDISTLPMGVSTVDAWQISSDVGTSETDEPRRISLASGPSSIPEPPRNQKRKLILFSKRRGL